MALPPSKPKKKKKAKKPQTPTDEPQSEESSVEEDDEEEDLDKLIVKKFPDFKKACQILDDLKKQFPQTGINGEKNIWIVKPAQSSRGRGIVLMRNLVEI